MSDVAPVLNQGLQLNERQRAMLAEMGVRVWSPLAGAPAQPAPDPEPEPEPKPAFVVRAAQPVQVPVPRPSVHEAAAPRAPLALQARP